MQKASPKKGQKYSLGVKVQPTTDSSSGQGSEERHRSSRCFWSEGRVWRGEIDICPSNRLHIPLGKPAHADIRVNLRRFFCVCPAGVRGAADLAGSGWGRSGPSAPGTAGPPRPLPPRAPQCPPRAPPTPRGCPGRRSRASTPPPPKAHAARQATAGGGTGLVRVTHELKTVAGPRHGIGLLP